MKDGQVVKDELNAFEQKHVKNETKVQNAAFKVGDKIKTKGKVGEVTDIDSRSVGAFGDVVTYKMKWPDGTESWEGNLHVLGTKVNEVEEEVKENGNNHNLDAAIKDIESAMKNINTAINDGELEAKDRSDVNACLNALGQARARLLNY
jgi:hypothetical protein